MAVIVPEFDMPTACKDCYLSAGYGCEHSGRIMTTKEMKKRADDCPLKSVEGLIEKINSMLGIHISREDKDFIEKIIREYCGEGKE